MIELKINGKVFDGVRLGENAINILEEPLEMKDSIRCSSRLEDGERIIYVNKVKSRSVTLNFTIFGDNEEEFIQRKKLFMEEIYKGALELSFRGSTYHFIYNGKSHTYNKALNQVCSVAISFDEPNPRNRK